MTVNIINKKKEIEEELRLDILRCAGHVPENRAIVILRTRKGMFSRYGDFCDINLRTGNGRMINTRCIGADARRDPGEKIFVVWHCSKAGELKIREYIGDDLFSESTGIN